MRKNTAPPFIKGAQEIRTLKPALGTDADHCVFMDKVGITPGKGESGWDAVLRSPRARPAHGPHGGPPCG